MSKYFFLTVFLPFMPLYLWAETTTSNFEDDIVNSRESCARSYEKHNCSSLLSDKKLKPYVKKCTSADQSASSFQLAKTCFSQAAGAWGEILKMIQEAPVSATSFFVKKLDKKIKPGVKVTSWQDRCRKNKKCLRGLIQAAYKRKLGRKELNEKIESVYGSWRSWQKIRYYYGMALNRDGMMSNNDPWFKNEMDRLFPKKRKKKRSEGIYSQVKLLLKQQYSQYQCLNSEGQRMLECYVFFSIVDPAIAYSAYAKAPKLSKLIDSLKKKKGKIQSSLASLKAKFKGGALNQKAVGVLEKMKLPPRTIQKINRALDNMTGEEMKFINKNPDMVFGKVRACKI